VLAIMDLESTDEPNQIIMGGLPMAHHLEMEQVLLLCEYEAFAGDVRRLGIPCLMHDQETFWAMNRRAL
jgi:hypothetical protein